MQRLIKTVIAVALANRSQLSIKCMAAGWLFVSQPSACVNSLQKCLTSGLCQGGSCTDDLAAQSKNWKKLVSDPLSKDHHKGNRGELGQLAVWSLQKHVHSSCTKCFFFLWRLALATGKRREAEGEGGDARSSAPWLFLLQSFGPTATSNLMLPYADLIFTRSFGYLFWYHLD